MLERNKKKLHRVDSGKHSDWEAVEEPDFNRWQMVAYRTHGLATIANLLTAMGLLLVVLGALRIPNGQYLSGACLIAFGRILDYFDGIAADKTKTKSRLGASFDEVADAVGLGFTLIIFLTNSTMPFLLLALVAFPKTLNAISWCISKIRKIRMDTTAQSKVATFIIWCGLLFYLLYRASDTRAEGLLRFSGWGLTLLGVMLSIPSSYSYLRVGLRKKS